MRTPILLYALALAVRLVVFATFPDPAYPDSYYYVDVARALAAGHGLTIDFVWIFAEVGNRIPANPVLPIPSNAHWLPLASFIQAPFIALLGPTAIASALPLIVIGATAAPLTWYIARDLGARQTVALGAAILSAIPAAGTVFMAQPENFALLQPLVAAALWLTARGLKGDAKSFALAGLLAGLASLARNDGVLLGAAIGLVWFADRVRWWRRAHASRGWTRGEIRRPIPLSAAVGCAALFLLVMVPWWLRQIAVFGSPSPTSSSGAALWIRTIAEWNSITAQPSLQKFLAQGPGPIIASRVAGLTSSIENFVVVICSVVLVPFVLVGGWARRRSGDFVPFFAYAGIVLAGATLLYPLHVPGGAFIHSAVGLEPYAYILAIEGVLATVGMLGLGRGRETFATRVAGPLFAGALVTLTVGTAVVFAIPVERAWDAVRKPRIALAAELGRLDVPTTDRLLSIDAAGVKYWTGRPGVVTPDDPLPTIEAVATAYDTRWLVLERNAAVTALAPVLDGEARPAWIGAPVFSVPDPAGGPPDLALYPVCTRPDDTRCGGG